VKRKAARRATALSSLVAVVDCELRAVYGAVSSTPAPLGNKRNPLDELVFIQLSVRTPEREYQTIYRELRRLVGGRWERLLSMDTRRPVAALRRGGMARVKVQRLRASFRILRKRFGRVTLAPLRVMSDAEAEAMLLELPGVGRKVARCILLYSLNREVFPVDSHCFRVLERLRIAPPGLTYTRAHDPIQAIVPVALRQSLHVNLIHHGRKICTPHRPRCAECVLLHYCPTGQQRTADTDIASVGAPQAR
jgi:endonuclease III